MSAEVLSLTAEPRGKTCKTCKIWKPFTEYAGMRVAKDRLQYSCKPCQKAHGKRYAVANRAKTKATVRAAHLRNRYGLTRAQYLEMLRRQEGGCAICGGLNCSGKRELSVDHDHATGQVRGLLCSGCNRAIGLMNDEPDKLRRAAVYLELHGRVK